MLTAHDDDGITAASLCVEVSSSNCGIGGGRGGIESSSLVAEDDTDLGELVNTGSTLEVVVFGPAASGMESVASCGWMIRETCMSACASTVMYSYRREDSDLFYHNYVY